MKAFLAPLLLLVMQAPVAGQTLQVSGQCEAYIYFSPDIPGLVERVPCGPLAGGSPGASAQAQASAGSARLHGAASIEARSDYGALGAGAAWSAHADAGASAVIFAVGGKATARATDYLGVGGQVGEAAIPVNITMAVHWDSGVSGNDARDRDAWMLEAGISLGFASGPTGGVPSAGPLALGFCGATDNVFNVVGPALELVCSRQGYGAHQVVASGTFMALPGSTNLLEYSLAASASFGGVHGTVRAADGALAAGGYLAAMNSLVVLVDSPDPRANLHFASGASYLAPVDDVPPLASLLAGMSLLLGHWARGRRRPCAA